MKFDIPRIVKKIALRDYAEEYGGAEICVWVNPPVRVLQEHDRIVEEVGRIARELSPSPRPSPLPPYGGAKREGEGEGGPAGEAVPSPVREAVERLGEELVGVFVELWSQGPEGTRWTRDEVQHLVTETQETDPQLWFWLRNRSIGMIREHRNAAKKG